VKTGLTVARLDARRRRNQRGRQLRCLDRDNAVIRTMTKGFDVTAEDGEYTFWVDGRVLTRDEMRRTASIVLYKTDTVRQTFANGERHDWVAEGDQVFRCSGYQFVEDYVPPSGAGFPYEFPMELA
jgi:Mg2+ and Co2+ transporter CorA